MWQYNLAGAGSSYSSEHTVQSFSLPVNKMHRQQGVLSTPMQDVQGTTAFCCHRLLKVGSNTWTTRIFLKPFLANSFAMTLLVLPFLSRSRICDLLFTFFNDAICNAVTCSMTTAAVSLSVQSSPTRTDICSMECEYRLKTVTVLPDSPCVMVCPTVYPRKSQTNRKDLQMYHILLIRSDSHKSVAHLSFNGAHILQLIPDLPVLNLRILDLYEPARMARRARITKSSPT